MANQSMVEAIKFFHEHNGVSWNPATETEEQGRVRCAREAANLEAMFDAWGFTFSWDIDEDGSVLEPDDNIRHNGDRTFWICSIFAWGENVGCLCGIDLGHNDPRSDPYARVVQVELAREHMK